MMVWNGKFAVYSDVQYHSWTDFSEKLDDGTTTRLWHSIEAFHNVVQHCLESDIQLLIHNGDLFQKRGFIDVSVYNAVVDAIEWAAEQGLIQVFIVGNHDRAFRSAVAHSLHAIEKIHGNVVVLDGHFLDIPSTDGVLRLHGIGYTSPDEWLDLATEANRQLKADSKGVKFSIALIHQDIIRARTHTGFVIESGLDPSTIETTLSDFDLILFGHYHCWQYLPNTERLIGTGALVQQNFGDRHQFRGFMTFEDGESILHESESPKFFELVLSSGDAYAEKYFSISHQKLLIPSEIRKDVDFVKFIFTRKVRVKEERLIKSKLRYPLIVEARQTESVANDVNVTSSMSIDEMCKRYLQETSTTLDKARLLETFSTLISDAT